MSFLESIAESISSFFKAFPFTFRYFAWFLLIPVAFYILILYITLSLENSIYEHIAEKLFSILNIHNESHWFFKTLKFLLQGILFLLFKLIFFFIFYFISGNVILMLLSPILSHISEKTEKIISQKKYNLNLNIWVKQISRSISLSLRNMFFQLLFVTGIIFISFIPIIGWIISPFSLVLIVLINAYFFGFSFLDFSFERKELTIRQSILIVRKNKGLAIGYGLIFYLISLIPFIGHLLAPFFAIFITVAATMSVEKMKLHD